MAEARDKSGRPFKNQFHRLSLHLFGKLLNTGVKNTLRTEGCKECLQDTGSPPTNFAFALPTSATFAPVAKNEGYSRRLILRVLGGVWAKAR
jgi:hypothetical protein